MLHQNHNLTWPYNMMSVKHYPPLYFHQVFLPSRTLVFYMFTCFYHGENTPNTSVFTSFECFDHVRKHLTLVFLHSWECFYTQTLVFFTPKPWSVFTPPQGVFLHLSGVFLPCENTPSTSVFTRRECFYI